MFALKYFNMFALKYFNMFALKVCVYCKRFLCSLVGFLCVILEKFILLKIAFNCSICNNLSYQKLHLTECTEPWAKGNESLSQTKMFNPCIFATWCYNENLNNEFIGRIYEMSSWQFFNEFYTIFRKTQYLRK